ncbi:peptide chain release factor 1-like, mitochondrial isoform X2 [Oppia nitens]|uniref:peptide chain release factor 1-like, mitochondrial isoform X2 n=1 Tax=Oppia nitens TaxID=1686743 RepID=UPI0023DBF8B5|nr:peptide chain release factor 1-like, mitochondrial isoform X2 [Oppia nitens]
MFAANIKTVGKLWPLLRYGCRPLQRRTRHQLSSAKIKQYFTENQLKLSPDLFVSYEMAEKELDALRLIETTDDSPELRQLAADDCHQLIDRLTICLKQIIAEAIQADSTDYQIAECCLDVNAGVGGQEAMLFTKELFDVYCRLCDNQKWTYSVVDNDCDTDYGGSRHSSLIIAGNGCYRLLRHEAGVHRVQRFPKTDRHRVHTSTTTVAVIPVRHNVVDIQDNDLVYQMTTSSGAGGQHVNRTHTCVRVTHKPTGIVATCQETRSQLQNKEIAARKLRAIINQMEYDKRRRDERSTKRAQNRITDHRLNDSLYDIEGFMSGGGNNSNKLRYFMDKLESQSYLQAFDRLRDELNRLIIT